jgi:hypothetical protein
MRAKSFTEILYAEKVGLPPYGTGLFYFTPLVGPSTVIIDQPFYLFAHGNFIPLPLLAGTVEAGGLVLAYTLLGESMNGLNTSAADRVFDQSLENLFGAENVKLLENTYPAATNTNISYSYEKVQQMGEMLTDYGYYCALRNASLGNQLPTSQYRLDYYNVSRPFLYRYEHYPAFLPQPDYCAPDQVCVGAELPYVFSTLSDSVLASQYVTQQQPQDEDYTLSENMNNAWANFIKFGNPNPTADTSFPLDNGFSFPFFDVTSESIQIIGSSGGFDSTSSSNVRASYCDLWDSLNEYPSSVYPLPTTTTTLAPTMGSNNNEFGIDSSLATAVAVPILLAFLMCVIWGVVRMTGRWKCDEVICAYLRGDDLQHARRTTLKHFVIETDDHDEESDGASLTNSGFISSSSSSSSSSTLKSIK